MCAADATVRCAEIDSTAARNGAKGKPLFATKSSLKRIGCIPGTDKRIWRSAQLALQVSKLAREMGKGICSCFGY